MHFHLSGVSEVVSQWTQGYVRQADAFSAMGEVRPALSALSTALRLDPSLRRSKGFQVLKSSLWEFKAIFGTLYTREVESSKNGAFPLVERSLLHMFVYSRPLYTPAFNLRARTFYWVYNSYVTPWWILCANDHDKLSVQSQPTSWTWGHLRMLRDWALGVWAINQTGFQFLIGLSRSSFA